MVTQASRSFAGSYPERRGQEGEELERVREAWRDLRVGDRIRLVAMPGEFAQPGYQLFPYTRRVYERLIARSRPVRVYHVDDWGLPWVRCRFRRRDGSWDDHSLGFNHDGWVRGRTTT